MTRQRVDIRIGRVAVDEAGGVDATTFAAALAQAIAARLAAGAPEPGRRPSLVDRTADAVVDALAVHGLPGARRTRSEGTP
jgi:hypothetical protein